MSLQVTSPAFADGDRIPDKYTGEGADVSPPLEWSGVPDGTRELALICDDPDAPQAEPWVHWVFYGLNATVRSLPENLPSGTRLSTPVAMLQGRNTWTSGRTTGYRGPLPPPGHGTHHYHFKLYALDAPLSLNPGIDKAALLKAMQGRILATGELIGTYSRE
ncbi:YbhB/YbcL family Raf kinase inhibitor-like protein [Planctellipticum variicoloris]|uniref:YbhB/YbcL family Raf kinase inhibitor-like protein n=1 Tax=Planctellipticum variicoloris TaxID=3064265 RepID=UPI003014167C|nr:YbhB/YbcL family Raf kinase inhibitor-like protein [Planctomycetaceae bacterium SH412]